MTSFNIIEMALVLKSLMSTLVQQKEAHMTTVDMSVIP